MVEDHDSPPRPVGHDRAAGDDDPDQSSMMPSGDPAHPAGDFSEVGQGEVQHPGAPLEPCQVPLGLERLAVIDPDALETAITPDDCAVEDIETAIRRLTIDQNRHSVLGR